MYLIKLYKNIVYDTSSDFFFAFDLCISSVYNCFFRTDDESLMKYLNNKIAVTWRIG